MSITQLLITILTFISPISGSTVTDLCDIVDTATGVPVWCEPHADGAPVLDKKVCCSADACVLAGTSCPSSSLFFCEFGERQADGTVECYFEVPNYCDVFPCAPNFQAPPLEEPLCCYEGACWHYEPGNCTGGWLVWCQDGVTNADGTVTCFD
jgi:hypothetical protein